jgi:hypothetical protein
LDGWAKLSHTLKVEQSIIISVQFDLSAFKEDFNVTLLCSDVVKSWQPTIFAGYCPFLAGYFSMSNKIMRQKNPYSNII